MYAYDAYLRFFNSSNLLVRSSKSTSSPPAEPPPTLLDGTLGRPGTSGNFGMSGSVVPGPHSIASGPKTLLPSPVRGE